MKKSTFPLLLALFFCSTLYSQNTSPFWSLAGNDNANVDSKLGTTNAVPLRLFTNNQPRIFIATNGRVGIGTTNPQQPFHIEAPSLLSLFVSTSPLSNISGSGTIGYTKFTPTAAGQRLGYFIMGSRGGGESNYHGAGVIGYSDGPWTATSYPSYMAFETAPAGSSTRQERMRITSNGSVGIGTTAPNTLLHINSTLAGQNPFRVQVNGATKLFVDENGGVSVGGLATPPSNGLYVSGNAGIGTTAPERRLHVFEGSAGVVTANLDAPLVVENNANTFINVLGPTNSEKGILFGDPGNAQDGGIIYSGASNSLLFRTNGNVTRMSLTSTGRLDVQGDSISFGSVESLFDAGPNVTGTNSSFVPATNCGFNLGSTTNRWNNVYICGSVITSSDARLKTNIQNLSYGLKEILKLRPVTYALTANPAEEVTIGLIAQEVQKVVPEMVSEAHMETNEATGAATKVKNEFLGLKYNALIPVLIKAMQEQQDQLESQQQQIEELKSMVNKLANGQAVSPLASNSALLQNVPNPTRGTTAIQYSIPEGGGQSQLLLTDALGRTIKVVQLTTSGVVNLDTSTLSSGVYNYSLVVGGKILLTKKMTVTR